MANEADEFRSPEQQERHAADGKRQNPLFIQ
jgi:hypothetical protein